MSTSLTSFLEVLDQCSHTLAQPVTEEKAHQVLDLISRLTRDLLDGQAVTTDDESWLLDLLEALTLLCLDFLEQRESASTAPRLAMIITEAQSAAEAYQSRKTSLAL